MEVPTTSRSCQSLSFPLCLPLYDRENDALVMGLLQVQNAAYWIDTENILGKARCF